MSSLLLVIAFVAGNIIGCTLATLHFRRRHLRELNVLIAEVKRLKAENTSLKRRAIWTPELLN